MFYVYMIKNRSKKLYIGSSKDPDQRLIDHNNNLGAKFTKFGNFELVFLEQYAEMKLARNREIQIKKWRREKKDILIDRFQNGLNTKLA